MKNPQLKSSFEDMHLQFARRIEHSYIHQIGSMFFRNFENCCHSNDFKPIGVMSKNTFFNFLEIGRFVFEIHMIYRAKN